MGLPGHVSAAAGGEVLATLERVLHAAASANEVDGLVYAPLNKQAMRDAGHDGGDETAFFARRLGGEAGEINMLREIWTSRVPPCPAGHGRGDDHRTRDRKGGGADARFLRSLGIAEPRLAVAALNPHAGEGGAFGREEIEVIGPAVAAAHAAGVAVEGPFPADSVFPLVLKEGGCRRRHHVPPRAALKLLGLGRGVTVIAGLPIPITTAGHGTAFDIAGKGVTPPSTGLAAAVDVCRQDAQARGFRPDPIRKPCSSPRH